PPTCFFAMGESTQPSSKHAGALQMLAHRRTPPLSLLATGPWDRSQGPGGTLNNAPSKPRHSPTRRISLHPVNCADIQSVPFPLPVLASVAPLLGRRCGRPKRRVGVRDELVKACRTHRDRRRRRQGHPQSHWARLALGCFLGHEIPFCSSTSGHLRPV